MDYRNKKNIDVVRLPQPFVEEKRLKCAPCSTCKQLVLAHPSENDTYKNDKKGVFLKKGLDSDVVTFTMEDDDGNTIANLGDVATFPNDDLAVGFVYDWQQIYNTHGHGCYKIKVNFTIGGITGDYTIGTYTLKKYSIQNARYTVRVFSKFNSASLKYNVDFTDSNFQDSVRFFGFFGNRQPNTEINQLINKGRISDKVTRENLNTYTLRTDPINVCYTKQLLELHLLHEDELFISDHNASNHSYNLFDLKVVLEESAEVVYTDGDRKAKINATFSDRIKENKSYYNKK
jgi:hypothetical protein